MCQTSAIPSLTDHAWKRSDKTTSNSSLHLLSIVLLSCQSHCFQLPNKSTKWPKEAKAHPVCSHHCTGSAQHHKCPMSCSAVRAVRTLLSAEEELAWRAALSTETTMGYTLHCCAARGCHCSLGAAWAPPLLLLPSRPAAALSEPAWLQQGWAGSTGSCAAGTEVPMRGTGLLFSTGEVAWAAESSAGSSSPNQVQKRHFHSGSTVVLEGCSRQRRKSSGSYSQLWTRRSKNPLQSWPRQRVLWISTSLQSAVSESTKKYQPELVYA